jgi:hypothetical protein
MLAEIVAVVEESDVGHGDVTEDFDEGGDDVEAAAIEDSSAATAALDEMATEPDFDPSATVQVEADEAATESTAEVEPEDEPETRVEVVTEGSGLEVEDEALGGETERPVADDPVPDEMRGEEPVMAETPVDEVTADEVPMPPPVEPVVPPPDIDEPDEEAAGMAEPLSAEDESRHEEARRFARLLVSEIKLYNEDAVNRGRIESDLYVRLKDDIDRSREMYEKRIPPEIRTARDYLHEELVRILADGDEGALGM